MCLPVCAKEYDNGAVQKRISVILMVIHGDLILFTIFSTRRNWTRPENVVSARALNIISKYASKQKSETETLPKNGRVKKGARERREEGKKLRRESKRRKKSGHFIIPKWWLSFAYRVSWMHFAHCSVPDARCACVFYVLNYISYGIYARPGRWTIQYIGPYHSQ